MDRLISSLVEVVADARGELARMQRAAATSGTLSSPAAVGLHCHNTSLHRRITARTARVGTEIARLLPWRQALLSDSSLAASSHSVLEGPRDGAYAVGDPIATRDPIGTEGGGELSEGVVVGKLLGACGAHRPNGFDFGAGVVPTGEA